MHTGKPVILKRYSEVLDQFTAYRSVKKVMAEARISGPQATPKVLRNGFVLAMLDADSPVLFHILRDLLGHSPIKTTENYDKAVGAEKRRMVLNHLKRKRNGDFLL